MHVVFHVHWCIIKDLDAKSQVLRPGMWAIIYVHRGVFFKVVLVFVGYFSVSSSVLLLFYRQKMFFKH